MMPNPRTTRVDEMFFIGWITHHPEKFAEAVLLFDEAFPADKWKRTIERAPGAIVFSAQRKEPRP